jgi:hypothetical protein
MMSRLISRSLIALLSPFVTIAACGDEAREEALPAPAPPIIRVSPGLAVLSEGDTVHFNVEAINIPTSRGFLWRTTDPGVVQVIQDGIATAIARGSVFVLVKPVADTSIVGRAEVTVE